MALHRRGDGICMPVRRAGDGRTVVKSRAIGAEFAADQGEMAFAAVDFALVGDHAELAVAGLDAALAGADDVALVAQPVADQLGNGQDEEAVLRQNGIKSGTRAISPSSRMISQMTPEGLRPAMRARSTEASVWPARTRTPPLRARSGKTWPGRARSV